MLTRLGAATVLEAADGAQALDRFDAAEAIDLVICDLNMPAVDGIETLHKLADRNPAARIILLSSADARVLRSAKETAAAFGLRSLQTLQKPLTLGHLREALAAPLPEAAPRGARGMSSVTAEDLGRGMAEGEFEAYYQPKVDIANGALTGVEALVRWRHPLLGLLSPAVFLPVAQACGRFADLTDLVLDLAVRRCVAWHRSGLAIRVSVNLPVASLADRELPDRLLRIVEAHGLPPASLVLEITEDGWLQQLESAREVLTRIRMRGFGLSIDDFGTVYSTAQQLLHAPFDELKIDQSFIRQMVEDEESAIVVSSTISLAHRLKLKVVAEGVETAAQWEMLARMGCDQAQGYFMSPPLPGAEIEGWAAAWCAGRTERPLSAR